MLIPRKTNVMLSSLAHLRKTILTFPQSYWILWEGTVLNRIGMLVLPFLAIYLTSERHLPSQVVGLIVALPGLGGILASLLMSALADRLSRKYVFVISLSVSACFLLTIPFLPSLLWLAEMVLLWSIASEAQRPLAGMLVMDLVSHDQRRQAISLLRLAINAGSMVSASIGGLIASLAFLPLFGADAGTTLLFALFMLLLFPRPMPPLQEVQAPRPLWLCCAFSGPDISPHLACRLLHHYGLEPANNDLCCVSHPARRKPGALWWVDGGRKLPDNSVGSSFDSFLSACSSGPHHGAGESHLSRRGGNM